MKNVELSFEVKMKLLSLVIAWCVYAGPVHAGAVIGATEPTQIMNNIQLLMSYVEQAQQTVTQMQQYQTMLKNLMNLTPSAMVDNAAQKLFVDQNMLQTFRNLQGIVIAGQKISYTLANVDSRFKQLHPGYGSYKDGFDFGSAYRNWSSTTLDSVKNGMSLVSAHADDFATEQQLVRELQSRSSSAQGQLAAVQAGNEIGVSMVGQLQKMRQLQMAQMNAQNAFIASQQSRQDAGDEAQQKIFSSLNATRLK